MHYKWESPGVIFAGIMASENWKRDACRDTSSAEELSVILVFNKIADRLIVPMPESKDKTFVVVHSSFLLSSRTLIAKGDSSSAAPS